MSSRAASPSAPGARSDARERGPNRPDPIAFSRKKRREGFEGADFFYQLLLGLLHTIFPDD